MNNLDFSFKDLYGVKLKSTYNMKLNGQDVEENETIAFFNSIQIANIDEIVKRTVARGGRDNPRHVFWETTDSIKMNFVNGVFSKTQFALLTNSNLFELDSQKEIAVDYREKTESNSEGIITLKYRPANFLFCYDVRTGQKIPWNLVSENQLDIGDSYKEVIVDYQRLLLTGGNGIVLGENAIKGYLSLEAKTRIKDDMTGEDCVGIIKIPRLKLVSNLSLRLGRNANPNAINFAIEGYPVGDKGFKRVIEFYFLDDYDWDYIEDHDDKEENEEYDLINDRH